MIEKVDFEDVFFKIVTIFFLKSHYSHPWQVTMKGSIFVSELTVVIIQLSMYTVLTRLWLEGPVGGPVHLYSLLLSPCTLQLGIKFESSIPNLLNKLNFTIKSANKE